MNDRYKQPLLISKILTMLFLVGASTGVLATVQIITPSPLTQSAAPSSPVSIAINYTTLPVDETLTGLSLRVHFDSSQLSFSNATYEPDGTSFSRPISEPTDDSSDFDNDPITNQFIIVSWVDLGGNFPGVNPATLATVNFNTAAGFSEATLINFSAASTPSGFDLVSTTATIKNSASPTHTVGGTVTGGIATL